MNFLKFLLSLFKRRNIGGLSVSPVGLTLFCLVVVAVVIVSRDIFEAKEIQAQVYDALNHARPIAEQARLMQERTGKWPVSLAEIEAAKAKPPPQVARLLLQKDGELRVVFASPPAIVNSTLILKVTVNGAEHFLECRGEGQFKGALPPGCKPGDGPKKLSWPPEAGKK
jgi:hypothetical protein